MLMSYHRRKPYVLMLTQKYMQEARNKVLHQPSLSGVNATSLQETNWKFVQTLLKECKNKVQTFVSLAW